MNMSNDANKCLSLILSNKLIATAKDNVGKFDYYLTNHLGSITQITNDKAEVQESYTYSVYGKLTVYDKKGKAKSGAGTNNSAKPKVRYTYTGREWDPETSLYYYRARWYSPDQGRFLARDPIGYVDGMTLYEYVKNSPSYYIDPFGLEGEVIVNLIQVKGVENVYYLYKKDENGKRVIIGTINKTRINCAGYGTGCQGSLLPTEIGSWKDIFYELGYACRDVANSDECKRSCGKKGDILMFYAYKYKNTGEKVETNKNSYWFKSWQKTEGAKDFHTIKYNSNDDTWECVSSYRIHKSYALDETSLKTAEEFWNKRPDFKVFLQKCCCRPSKVKYNIEEKSNEEFLNNE